MATNKNQHFVPRCYLRPFTDDASGKTINLYNLDRRIWIKYAPVKKQCAGAYFYGDDYELEKAIQAVEQGYSRSLRAVRSPGYRPTAGDLQVLKVFWLLQYLRTEAASRRAVEMNDATLNVAGVDDQEYRVGIREAVQHEMMAFAESMDVVKDLNACIAINKTRVPFVTSDDPAVLTNRWNMLKGKGSSFGLRSAGDILILPVSPSICFVGYDSDVYSVTKERGVVEVDKESDVDALNEHQFLNCRANLFVKNPIDFDRIERSYKDKCGGRLEARHRINYAVRETTGDGSVRFRVTEPGEAETHEEALIHSQVVYPEPSQWPSFLRWRHKGVVFTNGSGVGYVRRAWASSDADPPFRKVPA